MSEFPEGQAEHSCGRVLESVFVHPVYGTPRAGILRNFWEPDWVLRNPLRGLCIQGALN